MKPAVVQSNGVYGAVCYHYIRPISNDPFPRIRGIRQDVFVKHVRALQKDFRVISLADAVGITRGNRVPDWKTSGLLFTFDDGLADHYAAAQILAEHGIAGVFFVPTGILVDGMPINPVIIHHCLAQYGISKFIELYREALREHGINFNMFSVSFTEGADDPAETIRAIKKIFKYQMQHRDAKKILQYMYQHSLIRDVPDVFNMMHLTHSQIAEMVAMGHAIGAHTHSHLSLSSAHLSDEEFKQEVLDPKAYLEKEFGTEIASFSYPFGEVQDYADSAERVGKSGAYKLAFTVDKKLNTSETPRFGLGRHSVHSTDSVEKISSDLRILRPV